MPSFNVRFSRFVHASKALVPILTTDPGIVMLFNDVQFEKAYAPISVTLSGMSTVSRLVQLANA